MQGSMVANMLRTKKECGETGIVQFREMQTWQSLAGSAAPADPGKIDLARAKAEGKVVLYTSLDTQIVDSIIAPFREQYGIDVTYFRAGSAEVTGKILAEADAGRPQADMVDASDLAALYLMKERGMLRPFESAARAVLPPSQKDPDATWIVDRLTQGVLQYNVAEFGAAPPQHWADLGRADMVGRVSFWSASTGDGAPRIITLAQHLGWDVVKSIAKAKPLRTGSPQTMSQIIERRERGAGLLQNDNIAWRSKLQGKGTDFIFPSEGVPSEVGACGLMKASTRPHAAALLYEWWMSAQGQALLSAAGKYSPRTDVAPPENSLPITKMKLLEQDYATYKRDRAKFLDQMADVFAAQVRSQRFSPQNIVLGLAILVLLALVAYPMLWLILGALGVPQDLTMANFERAFTRAQNYAALANTVYLGCGTAVLSIAFGVPLAWAVARSDMPGRQVIHLLVALSYITPPYLTALAYIMLLGPDAGMINRLLRAVFGFSSGPLNIFTMNGVIFVIGIHVFAFTYFLTHSALKSIDKSLEESAQMLGARRWQTTLRINLPLVAPAITGGVLLSVIDSLALFGPQAIIGIPAQIVFLPTRIYATISSYPPRWGEASALSLVLVAMTVIGLGLQRFFLQRRSYVTIGGKGVRPQTIRTGGWRWALLAFCALVVVMSAVAPIGVLTLTAFSKNWTATPSFSNLTLAHFGSALFSDQVAARGIYNSFRLAAGAALVAMAVGAAIAYLDLRTTLRGRVVLDYLAMLPLGLPGTVMAVGVLLAFIRLPIAVYGTIWILLIAYSARFIPLATRSVSATLRQIDASLEEAGRITGATWLQSMKIILLPLARPGLLVAFLLVFIPAFSELSATILLYTGGTETIAIAIYRLNDLGQIEVVCALAVFTIAVVLVLSALMAFIDIDGIGKSFGAFQALADIRLSIDVRIGAHVLAVTSAATSRTGAVTVAIRPEALTPVTSPPEGQNLIEGTVRESMFLGNIVDLTIDIGGTHLHVQADRWCTLAPGDAVQLAVEPAECVAMAND
eukprot:gene2155-2192_t